MLNSQFSKDQVAPVEVMFPPLGDTTNDIQVSVSPRRRVQGLLLFLEETFAWLSNEFARQRSEQKDVKEEDEHTSSSFRKMKGGGNWFLEKEETMKAKEA